jgi:excisionase family DNA binding protein
MSNFNITQRDAPQNSKPLAVSVKTACRLLGIGNTKMWELIRNGRVQTAPLGRKRLVIYRSLERLLAPKPD